MTTILFDCDDVLLDWLGCFRKYASSRLQRQLSDEPTNWNMSEWLGTSDEVMLELVQEFNSSKHFGQLEATSGARETMACWLQVDQEVDYRFHVISSCSSEPEVVRTRRKNIENLFGANTFDSIHCLDLGQSKQNILQAWAPGAIWVEDNYRNALLGVEAGHNTFIRRRPHNVEFQDLHDERLTWFDDFSELMELV